jgi:hypothetical protein
MKLFSRLRLAIILVVLLLAIGAQVAPGGGVAANRVEAYKVFCVNGKVSFGIRKLSEMQWDYGKNVCVLAIYKTYAEAKEDVRRRGGVGASCNSQVCPPGIQN